MNGNQTNYYKWNAMNKITIIKQKNFSRAPGNLTSMNQEL